MGIDAMSADTPIVLFMKRFQGAFAIVAFLFSLLAITFVLGNMATPCNIAHGQSTCNVGDVEVFTGAVTFEDQIIVGVTPYAGTHGETIYADDDALTPPDWQLDISYVKIVDQTVTTSTTLVNDTVLTHTFAPTPSVIQDPPNQHRRYQVEGLFLINSDSTGDFDFQFSVPTNWHIDGVVMTDVGGSTTLTVFNETAETTLQTTSTTQVYLLQGVIHNQTGTATGTVTLQWAQNTSAGFTTLEEGSYIRFKEMRPTPT